MRPLSVPAPGSMTALTSAGLPESITEDVLRQLFEATGCQVVDVSLPKDRATGRPRGFGFVTLASAAEAVRARESLDGSVQAGRPVSEKVLWSLPRKHMGISAVSGEFTGLNVATGNHPIMIEFEARCDRFAVGRAAWATGDDEHKAWQEVDFMAGYPGVECPTHRVTIATDGQPITALRLQFPAGATVDLRQVRIRGVDI